MERQWTTMQDREFFNRAILHKNLLDLASEEMLRTPLIKQPILPDLDCCQHKQPIFVDGNWLSSCKEIGENETQEAIYEDQPYSYLY